GLDIAAGDLVEHRCKENEILLGDQHEFDVRKVGAALLELRCRVGARKTTTQNQNATLRRPLLNHMAPTNESLTRPISAVHAASYAACTTPSKAGGAVPVGLSQPPGGNILWSTSAGPQVRGSYSESGISAFSTGSTMRQASST